MIGKVILRETTVTIEEDGIPVQESVRKWKAQYGSNDRWVGLGDTRAQALHDLAEQIPEEDNA